MTVASGIGAAVFRWVMVISGYDPLSIPIGVLSCSGFLLIGMPYDLLTRRSIRPV